VRAAFETAVESHSQELGRFFLARYLGFDVRYADETCTVAFEVREDLCNPRGLLQGGVIATALDVAMAHLTQHLAGCGASTANLSVQYLSSVRAGQVQAKAWVARKGTRLWFLESDLRAPDGERVASASATLALTPIGQPATSEM
jgi:uncharacterized protein (TIGR00369 family)